MFVRKDYYSQTEVVTIYRITPERYKELLIKNAIQQVNREVDLGGYKVNTIYVLIKNVIRMMNDVSVQQ